MADAQDRANEILAAIAGLSDRLGTLEERGSARANSIDTRLGAIETRLGNIEGRLASVEGRMISLEAKYVAVADAINRVDNKVNGIARKVLAPSELVALGIQDARPAIGGGGESPPIAKAAKGR